MQFVLSASAANRSSSSAQRLLGWDTLRGLAAIMVVMLHAGIPYMVRPLPHLVWPARDIHPSLTVDAIVWGLECFLMPLFFVMGGFFSQGVLSSRGEQGFIESRNKRLLSTQMAAGFTILPVCLLIWTLGWMGDGLIVPGQVIRRGYPSELNQDLWGVSHLWFMQNIYIYCLVLCGISLLRKRRRRWKPVRSERNQRLICGVDKCLCSVFKPLIPAIPAAMILYWDPRIVVGFYQSFLPIISKLAYYSIYFFIGAWLYRHRSQLHLHSRFGWSYLVLSGVLFAYMLPMIHQHIETPYSGQELAVFSGVLSLFACTTTFGLLAVFLNPSLNNPATRYLAEASFWIYLIHLPLVVLTQIAIVELPVPTEAKYSIVVVMAMGLSLSTYQVFVRNTKLGVFLNGPRRQPAAVMDGPAPLLTLPAIPSSIAATSPVAH